MNERSFSQEGVAVRDRRKIFGKTELSIVAPLTLRSGLRQKGGVCRSAYPALIPSFRAAELGNSLGYLISRLRRSEHGRPLKS
jgi:hypothetical protein